MAIALQNYSLPTMVTPPRTPQFQIKPEPFNQHPQTPRSNEINQNPVIKSEPIDDYENNHLSHYPHYNFQQMANFGNPLGNLQSRFGQSSPNFSSNLSPTNFSTNFSSGNHSPINFSPTNLSPSNLSPTNLSSTDLLPTNLSPNAQISTQRPELPVTPESPLRTTPNPGSESPGRLSETYQDLGTPKKNQNKQKSFKCRMCEHVATAKEESWVHLKTHLKPEKMLCCPRCPFVTEYKHHLEYHLLNHDGSKPFVCPECEYMCVNKSMLRSHLKSHSQIYQYRCKDCDYVSKYCHTFKIHLRKYRHEPGPVLNPDGTEDHTKIIDVYGSRRGPRKRTVSIDNLQNPNLRPQLPIQNQIQTNLIQNLSIPKLPQMIEEPNLPQQTPLANPLFNPFLVNSMVLAQFMNLQRFVTELRNRTIESNSEGENNNDDYTCNVCGVSFKTETLFGIHMQYHDSENPLKCKTCGKTNENGETFFIHLTRERH